MCSALRPILALSLALSLAPLAAGTAQARGRGDGATPPNPFASNLPSAPPPRLVARDAQGGPRPVRRTTRRDPRPPADIPGR